MFFALRGKDPKLMATLRAAGATFSDTEVSTNLHITYC